MPSQPSGTDDLTQLLADFRLTPREAKVLVALAQLGSATVSELARFVNIERANIYRVVEALSGRRLVIQAAGPGRRWRSPGRDEVIDILIGEEEARHRRFSADAERARTMFLQLAPEAPQAALPYVQLVSRAIEVSRLYDRLLNETESELLVCNKAPYGGPALPLNPAIVDAMMRGVQGRALYESYELDADGAEALRQTRLVYHEVGVEGRVVDRLPIRLAVFDRRRVLLAMNDPVMSDRFPINLFIEHSDFADFAARSFEHLWESALRYQPKPEGASAPARPDAVAAAS